MVRLDVGVVARHRLIHVDFVDEAGVAQRDERVIDGRPRGAREAVIQVTVNLFGCRVLEGADQVVEHGEPLRRQLQPGGAHASFDP